MLELNLQYFGGRGASSPGGNFSNSLVKETVYHGTNADNITSFKTDGKESSGAIFFASDEDYAEEEAYIKGQKGGVQTMYEVKLNIQNPMRVTLTGADFADNKKEKPFIEKAKAAGFDSVIFDNGETDKFFYQEFYAVFSPKQVKIVNKKKI